jgi:3-oxoacyl-[acyl-carrier protein] reductase
VIQKMSDAQWDAILDVHLKAPFRILRAAQPVIRDRAKAEQAAGGSAAHRKVVNVSSVAGLTGNAGQVNYSSAKAGILGLTRTMSKEWGRYNVTVNAVAFGLIRTRLTEAPSDGSGTIDVEGRQIKVGVNPDLLASLETGIPLGRAGTPEEAAGAVYLLCSPESSYISGQVLVCGGGFAG